MRHFMIEYRHLVRPRNVSRSFLARIVITENRIDGDTGLIQSSQLGRGRKRRVEILHVGIEQVSREDQKIDLFLQTQIHDAIKRLPRSDP